MTRINAVLLLVGVATSAAAQTTPNKTPPPQSAPGAGSAARPASPPAAPSAAPAVDTTILPPQEIGTILVGQTRAGMLEIGDYTMGDATWADVWYLNLAAGQRVTVDLMSTSFDAYLQFLDPWGGKLADNDDGGGHGNSRLSFTAREAGRYQIVVNCSGDSPKTGRYTLMVH
ncbi:MAG TPA: PPC domain-containing protein [Gemmatimonadales bacterium]|jgi:hypothetical protein